MAETIKNRYEFVVLFDVENGNPNAKSEIILKLFAMIKQDIEFI